MANTEQSFGAASTTDDVLEGHDLTGTKVFVTGGNSGLGLETARAMAAKGAHVILAARDHLKEMGARVLGKIFSRNEYAPKDMM